MSIPFKYQGRKYYTPDWFQPFYGLSKYIKALFVVYIIISMLYTLAHFYALLQNQYVRSTLSSSGGATSAESRLTFRPERTVVGRIVLDSEESSEHTSKWSGRFSVITQKEENPLEYVSDQMLYSKLFQHSLKPSSIIPYYFRMTASPTQSDITIVTMISMERLLVFERLVNRYQGPVSVAVHVHDGDGTDASQRMKLAALEQLQRIRDTNPLFAKWVDLHLIVDRYDRQFNLWRNVARFFGRTDLQLMMDVDFFLCTPLQLNYQDPVIPAVLRAKVMNGSAVLVVPAFEFQVGSVELDVGQYPRTKAELIEYVKSGDADMFHKSWKRGHGPTDYERWYKATEPYRIREYNYNYEPYVLMKRDALPWCDERFVGYGANKAACLYEIFLSGAEFWALPQDFLIHQRHPYPESDRRTERRYNKRLYDAFREEACFRYGRMGAGLQGNDSTMAVDDAICGSVMPMLNSL